MPVQVTHNNDGHFYTIDVDIAKEGAEVFDLSTYFKARVADNHTGLRVRWFWQGQILNTVGKVPRVEGVVGQYSFKKGTNGTRDLVMSPDASAVAFMGDVNDCEPGGYATYYFPGQMFPQEGLFKGTIGLVDDSGETAHYTSVDIWFKVYPQAGGAQMGRACDFYISELDKAIKEAEDDLKTSKKAMQDVVDEFTIKMNDLTNRLTTQGETDQAALDALEAKIKQDGLFTQAQADAFKQAITQAIGNLANYTEPGDSLSEKLIAEADDRGINVRHFGVAADGKTDDSQAIQNAIYKAVDLYPRVNTVIMPGGIYKIDHTLIVPPYVKLRSTGLVTFVSSSPQAVAWIKWLGKRDPDIVGKPLGSPYYNADWQRGAIFGGGGFSFISTLNKADGIGLEAGFESTDDPARNGSSQKSTSRYTLGDISISGFKIGLKLNTVDLYIAKHSNLHIENNGTGVLFAGANSINSGESIVFDNCTIAHCSSAFDIQTTADLSLLNCCLDFNENVFTTGAYPNFNITVTGGNVEGNKRIFDGSVAATDGWKATLTFLGSTIYVRNDMLENPDTLQFKGPLNLNLYSAYIIANNNVKAMSYLADSKVFVKRSGSLRSTRHDGQRYLLSEGENNFIHGRNLSLSLLESGKSENGNATLSQNLPEIVAAGLPSALVFSRTSDSQNNWDKLKFVQHVNVNGKKTYALSTWLSYSNSQNTFSYSVKFWSDDGYLLRTDNVYFYDAKPSDQAQFLRSAEFDVPPYSSYATVDIVAVVKNVGEHFAVGYIGFECD